MYLSADPTFFFIAHLGSANIIMEMNYHNVIVLDRMKIWQVFFTDKIYFYCSIAGRQPVQLKGCFSLCTISYALLNAPDS